MPSDPAHIKWKLFLFTLRLRLLREDSFTNFQMFFIKCHHKFSNGSFKKVRRSFVSLFLASKRQANKNFNQIVFLFREVICLFCLKQKFIWRSFNKKLQNSFLKFFPNKFFFLKSIFKVPGKKSGHIVRFSNNSKVG